MSYQRIIINSPLSSDGFKSVCNLTPGTDEATNAIAQYFEALAGGNQMALVNVQVGAVQSSAIITSTGTATAAQTMSIANIVFTAVASAPAANQFVVSATVATQAANIAAAINASVDLAGKVTANAVSGVVTVTSVVPGVLGNAIQISNVNLANISVTQFVSGSDGTSYTIDHR